jgi:predicted phosphodiesterase
MRVAVVSDIHANYHALAAVLAALDTEAPDEIWCLGDIVGYGPHPNECCDLIAARAKVCLAGNHDLAVLGAISLEDFNGDAAAAVRWTRGELTEASRVFLSSLEPTAMVNGAELFHGSPLDPVWDYVLTESAAVESFLATTAPLLLVGHSHLPLALSWSDERLDGGVAPEGAEVDLAVGRTLLNPGSVGQPRGNDPRAAWLVIQESERRATFQRTPYPIEKTQAEMRKRGLPEALAARLEQGV